MGVVNVDKILLTLNASDVDYVLIGGMNFLLRHLPELTFDVDIWVRDNTENLQRLNTALRNLGAAWGPREESWKPVGEDWRWLATQGVFCLTTDHGAVDIFREVFGLEGRYDECRATATRERTAAGTAFVSLSDEHMLACQQALPAEQRKLKRMEVLQKAIDRKTSTQT